MISILIVCRGNTCRSPMAQYVLKNMANRLGLGNKIHVVSAGTRVNVFDNRLNTNADQVLAKHDIPYDSKRLSQEFESVDFAAFDGILAMDNSILNDIRAVLSSMKNVPKLGLFLDDAFRHGQVINTDVPDPWGNPSQYEKTYEIIEIGCDAIINRLKEHI